MLTLAASSPSRNRLPQLLRIGKMLDTVYSLNRFDELSGSVCHPRLQPYSEDACFAAITRVFRTSSL